MSVKPSDIPMVSSPDTVVAPEELSDRKTGIFSSAFLGHSYFSHILLNFHT